MTNPGEPSIEPLVPPSLPPQAAPHTQDPQAFPQPQAIQQPQPAPPSQPWSVAYPYAAPAWPPPAPGYGGWAPPPPGPAQDPAEALRKARTALGWAIGAAVGAFLALGIAMVALFLGGFGAGYGEFDSGLPYESLRGQVVGVTDGADLPGSDLETSMTTVLEEWYVDVQDLSCPDTRTVTMSTAVVCTAELDGFEWTGVVFFEDAVGGYVILEL